MLFRVSSTFKGGWRGIEGSDVVRVAEAAAKVKADNEKTQDSQQKFATEILRQLGKDIVAELIKRRAQKSAVVRLKSRVWDFGGDALPKVILDRELWTLGELAVTELGTFHRYLRTGVSRYGTEYRVTAKGLQHAGNKFSSAAGYLHVIDVLFSSQKPTVQEYDDSAEDVFHLKDDVLCWGKADTPADKYLAAHLVAVPIIVGP